jgi:hypothetical protein
MWIGVAFHGGLTQYAPVGEAWAPGMPNVEMINRVIDWLGRGVEVRVVSPFLAGLVGCVQPPPPDAEDTSSPLRIADRESQRFSARVLRSIDQWCAANIGRRLPITCTLDADMAQYWGCDARRLCVGAARTEDEILRELVARVNMACNALALARDPKSVDAVARNLRDALNAAQPGLPTAAVN